MIARISLQPEEYSVSSQNGFLPSQEPLQTMPSPYYAPWEAIMVHLPELLKDRTLRNEVDALPILSTEHLTSENEWQRAYSILAFLTHSYIWGGEKPSEILPATISVPFLAVSEHLALPPTATYAGLNLWNWAPYSPSASLSLPENLRTLQTFTGTRDEEWFYLISVAMEARCAAIIPVMLKAIDAARIGDSSVVEACLLAYAQCALDLGILLERMYEECDPYVFYYQIRPFLAGSKNMEVAGLPKGVFYDEGNGRGEWRKYSGGSNAQSSLIQFLDAVLSVEHGATGELKGKPVKGGGGFLQEMRTYMPGPHAQFLEAVTSSTNIRAFVVSRPLEVSLGEAFNSAIAQLAGFRDKHIKLVTRYIVTPSRNPLKNAAHTHNSGSGTNIATASDKMGREGGQVKAAVEAQAPGLYGTGGTQLIPFLQDTRNETRDTAVFPSS